MLRASCLRLSSGADGRSVLHRLAGGTGSRSCCCRCDPQAGAAPPAEPRVAGTGRAGRSAAGRAAARKTGRRQRGGPPDGILERGQLRSRGGPQEQQQDGGQPLGGGQERQQPEQDLQCRCTPAQEWQYPGDWVPGWRSRAAGLPQQLPKGPRPTERRISRDEKICIVLLTYCIRFSSFLGPIYCK